MFDVVVGEMKYHVKFWHGRGYGGMMTTCEIDPLAGGVAHCSPKDQFDRNKGRKIAMMRALQAVPKADRQPFWDAYFSTRHGKF
jgi:hypothetical protein